MLAEKQLLNSSLDASMSFIHCLQQSQADRLVDDLAEAEGAVQFLTRQKHEILDDVDKLKGLPSSFSSVLTQT